MCASVTWLTRSVLVTSSVLLSTLLTLSAPTGMNVSSDSQESPCDEWAPSEGCWSSTPSDTDSPEGPPSTQTGGLGPTSTDWFVGGSTRGAGLGGLTPLYK